MALRHTKRNVVSIISRLYDPLGFIAPAVIPLKIFFQELCESRLGWDEPMTELLSAKWIRLLEGLRADEPLHIARCYYQSEEEHYILLGFCDASQRAYAVVAYLCNSQGSCSLVPSKTRVAPLLKQTVPRLQLLGAVLLSRLISSIREGLGDLIVSALRIL